MHTFLEYLHQMSSGPGHLRFFVQPLVALLLGVRDGRLDRHRAGPRRGAREELRRITVPLTMAVLASLLFQYLIMGRMRLVLALGFALLFVALPYLATRRVSRGWNPRIHAT